MILMLVFLLAVPMFAAAENDRETLDLNFEDTNEGYWAQEYIERMKAKGVFQGYEDGTFRPNDPVTRIQTIVTAVRLLGLEEEAKAQDLSKPVFFKDATEYFKNPGNLWAKGYVLVALEQGLFDASEDRLSPNQPAKRVWVSSILVRALGLEEEARAAITVAPSFVDANQIPAGSVGYVNIAEEYGIITGNPDGRFSPNTNITRSQMAAVLDRTYDGLLDEQGVTFVRGTLVSHNAEEKSLTIEHVNGEQVITYADGLYVLYKGRLIQPSQLQAGDELSLYVLNDQVVEAEILDSNVTEQVVSQDIQEFEIEAKYANDGELEIEYKIRKGHIKAELKEELDDSERKVKGEQALKEIQAYVDQWGLTSSMSQDEIVTRIRESLSTESELIKLEIEIKFSDGTKVKYKDKERDEKKHKDREKDKHSEYDSYQGVLELKVEIETHDKDEHEWEYKHEKNGKVKAGVESKVYKGKKEKLKSKEAQAAIEAYLDSMQLTDSMTEDELVEAILQAAGINFENVKEIDVKVQFDSGVKLEVEKKNKKVVEEDNDDDDEEEVEVVEEKFVIA